MRLILAAMLQAASPAQQTPPVPQQAPAEAPPSDDIVVTGLRDIMDPDAPVSRATLGSLRTGNSVRSRAQFATAEAFAACTARTDRDQRTWLRSALDGVINGARQSFAQQCFVALNATCAPDPRIAMDLGTVAGLYYDRSALYLSALQTYAPDARLTKRDTSDPAVQARFNAREEPRARFRLPTDRT